MTRFNFASLAEELKGDLVTDTLSRYMLATDGSIFQKMPLAVVYPRDTFDVVATVRFAARNGVTLHPRGAGSGLCGSSLGSGMVVDFTRYMHRLIHLDVEGRTFQCQPGYRLGQLNRALDGTGLFFPPDPSSGEYASFGGMFNTNASGAHSVKYGNVGDYVVDATLVLGNGQVIRLGEIVRTDPADLPDNLQALVRLYLENQVAIEGAYPHIRFNVAGYNLRDMVANDHLDLRKLFAGAEGTLGIVTELTLALKPKPAAEALVVAFFDAITPSARAVQKLLPMGPAGIEVMDKSLLEMARRSEPLLREKIPAGIDNVLMIEFDGDDPEKVLALAAEAKGLLKEEKLTANAHLAATDEEKARFWGVRKAAVPILYRLKGRKKILALIEDAVVPTDRLVDYFDGLYDILERHKVAFVLYGHIAKGLLHSRPLLDLKDKTDLALLKPMADDVFALVHALGGSVSGEHGDGRLRSAYIQRLYPRIHPLFNKVKSLLDGQHLFNPEIKTHHDPHQMQRDLRYGEGYRRQGSWPKNLRWAHSFAGEVEKCHGCSKCTTVTTATRMCPIFKFTRQEAATPKAKANVLRALISGAMPRDTVYTKAFRDVMAHCVACGSCRVECPSKVDIPKLAMEAKAQHVQRLGLPLGSRILANTETAGRAAGSFAALMGPLAGQPLVRRLGQALVGISARRRLPAFAPQPLTRMVPAMSGAGRPRVLYFAGCYASYLRPEIGAAALGVLKRMGMTILTPPQHCCGLPLLSKGMVDSAREKIVANQAAFEELLHGCDHIVVTCSSCGLALSKEWRDLAKNGFINAVAQKMIHISALVNRYRHRLGIRKPSPPLAYHLPCHLAAQSAAGSSLEMLAHIPGEKPRDLQGHCCGMAGSWGLLAANENLSRHIGMDLVQRVERSGARVVATDCPTCRMQLEELTDGKRIVHPIEIVAQSV